MSRLSLRENEIIDHLGRSDAHESIGKFVSSNGFRAEGSKNASSEIKTIASDTTYLMKIE